MKKTVLTLIIATIFLNLKAQRYNTYDTLHKHELSFSALPLLNYFSGSYSYKPYVNFNLFYKHYFKNKFVLRTALVYFPGKNGLSTCEGVYIYDRTVGVKNVFSRNYSSRSDKWQFNLGAEKIFKINRLMHGFGGEIFINKWRESFKKNYEYRYIGINPINRSFTDTTNYSVDSLNTQSNYKHIGIGLQVFYSLRYQISKHWYISTTIGPNIAYLFINSTQSKNNVIQASTSSHFLDDFNVGLISDISICFRL